MSNYKRTLFGKIVQKQFKSIKHRHISQVYMHTTYHIIIDTYA